MNRLAYLFPAFPVFHQTFVLWEVLGLQRNGVQPLIYSMRPGTEKQQPEAADVAGSVRYLPGLFSVAVLTANLRLLLRSPRRYFSLYRNVVKAWRTGGDGFVQDGGRSGVPATAYNRFRGWLNGNPLPYLAKSLVLVPTGVLLAERLQRDGVTHLHVHWATYPATVAFVVYLVSGMPFSISAHAYDIYMTQRMLPAKVQAARFVVTCAKTNQRFLERVVGPVLARKISVVYHGVDVSRFAAVTPEIKSPGSLRVVSCGQLERYKGMHRLIDACAELARRGIRVECAIVGEGPERTNLEKQIDQLGLAGRVQLAGSRPHAEWADMLRHADAFVLASELVGKSRRRDVIANVIVEAMGVGLPVVASSIPGVEELIDDGSTGLLVPPNEIEPLTAAMERLAEHPEERLRLGRAARRRILQDFDSAKNVQVLAHMLDAGGATLEQPTFRASRGAG